MSADESDPAREEHLRRILDGARRLSHTTQELLTLARADESVNPGLGSSVSIFVDRGNGRGRQPRHGRGLGRRSRRADRRRMRSMESTGARRSRQGVSDQRHYTHSGGRQRDRSLRPARGRTLSRSERYRCRYSGSRRARVVERFVRASNTRGNGSGLGLAIVKDVTTLHRGDLSIDAGPNGIGTTVRITFPRHAAARLPSRLAPCSRIATGEHADGARRALGQGVAALDILLQTQRRGGSKDRVSFHADRDGPRQRLRDTFRRAEIPTIRTAAPASTLSARSRPSAISREKSRCGQLAVQVGHCGVSRRSARV